MTYIQNGGIERYAPLKRHITHLTESENYGTSIIFIHL